MKRSGVIVFGLGLLFAPPLAAQNISPTLPDQGTVQYIYNYPGSFIPASWNSVFVGPYEGTLVSIGSDPTSASISLYCVDFFHYVMPGKLVTADVSNIGGGNTSLARLGATGLASYQKAAFLASLFSSYASLAPFSALTQAQAWSGIHAAIWYYTSGGGPYTGDPYWEDFRDYAAANYESYTGYGQWSILTTTAIANSYLQDSQEFLVQTAALPATAQLTEATVSPEPQTYVLMVTGLIFMALFGRRRLRELENA